MTLIESKCALLRLYSGGGGECYYVDGGRDDGEMVDEWGSKRKKKLLVCQWG